MPTGDIAARYEKLSPDRTPFLDRARLCAELTIPTLVPPAGAGPTTAYRTPFQSMGARGVNNLASKLLLSLFQPNSPFFKLVVDDYALEKLTQAKGMRGEVEKALSKIERTVMSFFETSAMRPALFEALKHMIVAGNVLLILTSEGKLRVFRMDRYVVKRDPQGNPLEIITHEKISVMELPLPMRQAVLIAKTSTPANEAEDTVDLYTRAALRDGRWYVDQEVCGVPYVDGHSEYPKDKFPWMALRLVAMDNEDYGRSYVEEFLGDLRSLEALQRAIVQASAAAAKVLFLVRPNGTTSVKVLSESESGDIRPGHKDDVTVLQMEKQSDMSIALQTVQELTKTLSYAFLLNTAIQREGERVTAEEIRTMVQELEASLGGIYANMSQALQLPLVILLMSNMTRRGRLPPLPEKLVKPAIVTGVDAIGRGNDVDKLRQYASLMAETFGPEAVPQYIKPTEYSKRLAAGLGLDPEGLVPSDDEIAAMQQQQQMQGMVEKLGPNFVNQMGQMAQKQQEAPAAQP